MVSDVPWHPEMEQLEHRLNDRIEHVSRRFRVRQILLYVVMTLTFIIVIATATYFVQQREESRIAFQHQITTNCYTSRKNTQNLNAALDQLIESARTNKILTPQERAQRIAFYTQIKGEVPDCPP
jgi:hypothetical protein